MTLTVNSNAITVSPREFPITVMNLPHGVRIDDIGLNGVMITEEETTRTVHIVAEPWVQPSRCRPSSSGASSELSFTEQSQPSP